MQRFWIFVPEKGLLNIDISNGSTGNLEIKVFAYLTKTIALKFFSLGLGWLITGMVRALLANKVVTLRNIFYQKSTCIRSESLFKSSWGEVQFLTVHVPSTTFNCNFRFCKMMIGRYYGARIQAEINSKWESWENNCGLHLLPWPDFCLQKRCPLWRSAESGQWPLCRWLTLERQNHRRRPTQTGSVQFYAAVKSLMRMSYRERFFVCFRHRFKGFDFFLGVNGWWSVDVAT